MVFDAMLSDKQLLKGGATKSYRENFDLFEIFDSLSFIFFLPVKICGILFDAMLNDKQ